MSLKAIVTADEFGELGDDVKGFYTETDDGGYVLDVEGVDDMPTVKGLKSGHQRSKQERDQAKKALDTLRKKFGPLVDLEDLDLSDADQERLEKALPYLKGERDSLDDDDGGDGGDKGGKKNNGNQPDLEKIKANARKPVERERDEAVERAEKAEGQLQSLVVDNALTNALTDVKIASPYVVAVKAMFRDKVKVTEGDDGAPVAMIEGEYGEQPVAAYLKEWSQTDQGKAFVAAPENGGGGARTTGNGGGKIKNPFKKKTEDGKPNPNFSITEQGRLQREQPDVARRMAKEAGWSDDKIRW